MYALTEWKGAMLLLPSYTQKNRSEHKGGLPVVIRVTATDARAFKNRLCTMLCDTDGPSHYFLEQTQCFRTNQTFYVVSISDSPSRVAK
jgi:hypothetical protein